MDDPSQGLEARWRTRRFAEHMARCEAAWCAGVSSAVTDAVLWCYVYGQAPPSWLVDAVVIGLAHCRTKAEAKRRLETQADYERYDALVELRERRPGLSWEECYAAVADMLGNTTERSVKASYLRVACALRTGRGGKYFQSAAR
jgi:hypothetical protein